MVPIVNGIVVKHLIYFNESMNIDDLNTIEEGYSFSFLLQHPENKIVKEYIQPNCISTMVSK